MDRPKWALAASAAVLGGYYLYQYFNKDKASCVTHAQPASSTSTSSTSEHDSDVAVDGSASLRPLTPLEAFEGAARAVKRSGVSITDSELLKLYAFFKQATQGPCDVPKPGMLEFRAFAKWNAWKSLGDMEADTAREQYVLVVQTHLPDWRRYAGIDGDTAPPAPPPEIPAGSTDRPKPKGMSMVPAVSTMLRQEEDSDLPQDVFFFASGKDATALREYLDTQTPADLEEIKTQRSEGGETALHVAVDSGDLESTNLLIDYGWDLNATESEAKQTPLHYAVMLEFYDIAKLLIKSGADTTLVDVDEGTAIEFAPAAERATLEALCKQ